MTIRPPRIRNARGPDHLPLAGRRVAFVAAGVLVLGVSSLAQTTTPAPGPSLDELLGLDPPPQATPLPPDEVAEPAAAPDAGPAADPATSDEPFAAAAAQMERAAARLDASRDAGLDTQRLQEDVLARLDQLIADAVNNAPPPPPGGGGGGGASGTPDNGDAEPSAGDQPGNGDAPAPGSGAGTGASPAGGAAENPSPGGFSPGRVGPTGPEAGPLREVRTEWGALPPRLRDELSNGLDEPFSPIYRRQTEAFYRRLAEDAAQ